MAVVSWRPEQGGSGQESHSRSALYRRQERISPTDAHRRVAPPSQAWPGDRYRRILHAVDELVASGRSGEGAALARTSLGLPWLSGDEAVQLRLRLSGILLMQGKPVLAVAEADAALATRGVRDDLIDAAELARMSALLVMQDAGQLQAAVEAIVAGGYAGDGSAFTGALMALAANAWDQGRAGFALGLMRAIATRAARQKIGSLRPRIRVVSMLTDLGEFEEAAMVLTHVQHDIASAAQTMYRPLVPLLAARLYLAAGRLGEANSQGRLALALGEDLEFGMYRPFALTTLAEVAVARGDLDGAAALLRHYRADPASAQLRVSASSARWTSARLAEARQGPVAAAAILAGLQTWLAARPMALVMDPALAAFAARVALAVGDTAGLDTVRVCVEHLAASNPGFASITAAADHVRGLVHGDVEPIRSAAGRYRHPWAAASAHEDTGVLLANAGDRPGAHEAYQRALTKYTSMGADRDAERLRTRLAQIGPRRPRGRGEPRPVAGWPSLTDTERTVALLVSEGLRNAQVADRLFMSPHTVDFHLRHVFRKVGVRSRVQLTRYVMEQDG